jgi:hypothetical protein
VIFRRQKGAKNRRNIGQKYCGSSIHNSFQEQGNRDAVIVVNHCFVCLALVGTYTEERRQQRDQAPRLLSAGESSGFSFLANQASSSHGALSL